MAAQHGRSCRLSRAALESLARFDWPGNVRALRNALENAMIFARGEEIQPGDLPSEVRTAASVGLHRQSLQEKLRELGIHRPGKA